MIYARSRNDIGPNNEGGMLCQAELYTTTTPNVLPSTGENIVGMNEKDTFAAGSVLICTTSKNVYILGEDEGTFELWRTQNG